MPIKLWPRPQKQRCVFIHVEGTEEISGIDAKGSYEESKYNEKEAIVAVSYMPFLRVEIGVIFTEIRCETSSKE